MFKKVIQNFKPLHGHHCVTNSLKQIFSFNQIEISEEMLFGLASGLNFIYFESKQSPVPVIGGRIKIGDFEENLAESIGIKIVIHETSSKKKSMEDLKKQLEKNIPLMIYTDMAYLPYLELPDNYHFGGHSVVVFGLDEEQGICYVSDRDGKGNKVTMNPNEVPDEFHILSIENLQLARGSKEKPYPPKNKWLQFDFTNIQPIKPDIIYNSIRKNVDSILNPPIKNIGITGIELFSSKMKDWSKWDDDTLKFAAIDAFVMINKVGGNGGGCFRRMYGNFLIEAGQIANDEFLEMCGNEFLKISVIWDSAADNFYKVFETLNRELLKENENKLFNCFLRERELLLRLSEHLDLIQR